MPDRFPAAAPAVPDWRTDAACRHVDPEIFFPLDDGASAPDHPANAAALAICAPCPVRVSCLLYALGALPYGIAGGLTAAQRRDLRHALRTRRPATPRYYGGERGAARARGIALLRTGAWSCSAIADRVGVSTRTVNRWAASAAATDPTPDLAAYCQVLAHRAEHPAQLADQPSTP